MSAQSKLNSGQFLTSKALIDEFASTNDMLREFYHMKKENWSKKLMINKSLCYIQKQCHLIVWSVEKIQKIHIQKL